MKAQALSIEELRQNREDLLDIINHPDLFFHFTDKQLTALTKTSDNLAYLIEVCKNAR